VEQLGVVREPHIALDVIGQGIASLKSGSLSLVFHAPHDQKEQAVKIHDLQGKRVRLEIYTEMS
jgi:hypothetical protein